jgi:hypothetical protein
MPLTPVKALEEVSGSWGSDFFQIAIFRNLRFVKLGPDLANLVQICHRFSQSHTTCCMGPD